MAQIDVYQNQSGVGAPAVDVSNVRPDNSGAMALAGEGAKTGTVMAKGINAYYDKVRTADVMSATNEYNRMMGEGIIKLQEQKEGEARNVTKQYDDLHNDVIGKIKKRFGSTIGFGDGAAAFDAVVTKDYGTRRLVMEKYQSDEMEKYADTTLDNGLTESQSMAFDNYKNPGVVKGIMDTRIPSMIAARYWHYGPDKIKEETLKRQGEIATNMMVAAVGNSDWKTANDLLINYGSYMTGDKRSAFGKMIKDQIKTNNNLTTFQSLYTQYKGQGIEAFLKAAGVSYDTSSTAFNDSDAVKTARADLGKKYGVNDCTTRLNSWLGRGGSKLSSLDATDAWNALDEKDKLHDTSQLKNGDIIFWSPHGDGNATHTGIYDAEKGKVIQSGTSGVDYLDVNFYPLVGFAHPKGDGSKSTPADREKYMNDATSYYNKQKGIEQEATNELTKKTEMALKNAFASGVRDYATLASIAAQNSVNSDGTVNQEVLSNMNYTAYLMSGRGIPGQSKKKSGSGSGSGGNKDPMAATNLKIALLNGDIDLKQAKQMVYGNTGGWSNANISKMLAVIQHAEDGTGVFNYHLEDYKDYIMSGYDGNDKKGVWRANVGRLTNQIQQYTADKGEAPDSSWIEERGRKNLAEGTNFDYVEHNTFLPDSHNTSVFSEVDMEKAGIKNITPANGGGFWLTLKDGSNVTATDEDLQAIKSGKTVNEVIFGE